MSASPIDAVIRAICETCAKNGAKVSEVLAAFVARTVLEGNPSEFELDAELKDADVSKLVALSVERLLERDSPSAETIKMQVGFDCSYVATEEVLLKGRKARADRAREGQRAIAGVQPKGGSDFDALTGLYRQIFAYLLAHYDTSDAVASLEAAAATNSRRDEGEGGGGGGGNPYAVSQMKEQARNVEREVAAALESVFPRIGLKSFIQLTRDQKYAQLEEMANIVLGIRLFNREIGKGGVGLPPVEEDVYQSVLELKETIEGEAAECQDLCLQYQETIVYAHLRQPPGVTQRMVQRWKDELANRRQYLSYLQSLLEDVSVSLNKATAQREVFLASLDELQTLVGGRSSVPKEHVYPKFEAAAVAWLKLVEEQKQVEARSKTLAELRSHAVTDAYHATLTGDSPVVHAARAAALQSNAVDEEADIAAAAVAAAGGDGGGEAKNLDLDDAAEAKGEEGRAKAKTAEAKGSADGQPKEAKGGDMEPSTAAASNKLPTGEMPVKLSIESTPEFMQLPLEYQGFCPWTIVKRHGLLLPGKPALGVVRYTNQFFVFAHAVALQSFMGDPEGYKAGVRSAARQAPELIHLLRLQEDFPSSSISKLIDKSRGYREGSADNVFEEGKAPERRDASTETPTHFVERNIDVNYSWNEWELRRRALQMTNIRKCRTKGQQTDASHFRRENDSQVYLPEDKVTMTMKESGTQPPVVTQYVAGLRGTPAGPLPSKYAKGRPGGLPGILNLVLEPGAKEGHGVVGGRSQAF